MSSPPLLEFDGRRGRRFPGARGAAAAGELRVERLQDMCIVAGCLRQRDRAQGLAQHAVAAHGEPR